MGIDESFSETYEILGKIGEGAGGIIYKAYHKRLQQYVVLKQVRNKSTSDTVNRREVDILKNLQHSYLPKVLDFLEINGSVYTVMNYISGRSFAQLIQDGYIFTQQQLIRWGMQISSALNCLHSQNPPVIHGDIKPSNIMLTQNGDICLIDFNISFYFDHSAMLGYTNGYASPEQYKIAMNTNSCIGFSKKLNIDERTDIYSVGAAFYHIVTGQKIKKYKIEKKLLVRKIGESFAQVIECAVKKNPQERYQTALELFHAFENVSRKEKQYRNLLYRQAILRMGLLVSMSGFIVLGGYGIHRVRRGITESYNDLVKEQIESRKEGNYQKQEKLFKEPVFLLPKALESYYQNAYSLYEQEEYEECIEFIDYDICHNEDIEQIQVRMADVYYLQADSYFKLGLYEEAVNAYEKIFQLGTQQINYYRDYAVALSYNGDIENGKDVLQEAIDYGLEEDSIYYTKGEIEHIQKEYDTAIQEFRRCISITDDNELKERAYLMMESIYDEKDEDAMQREILLEAKESLPFEKQMQVLERLAKIDIKLADKNGDNDYMQEAIETLLTIDKYGWSTFHTYDTLAVLYEKQEKLEEARNIVDIMLDKYGEDYRIYMRYAFIEIDMQERFENNTRDYKQFALYYEKALQLYNKQVANNNDDSEMQFLKNLYEQVLQGGWLD